MLAPFWDGNWLDISSGLGGAAWAIARCVKRRYSHKKQSGTSLRIYPAFFCKTTAVDLASGTSLVPLMILSMALFSSALLQDLMTGNRLILTIAGVTSLFGALEDF
jgi:hypothetical protein